MRPERAPQDIRRILIVKWSAMGDVVLATALMEDIRRAFPTAVLHLNTLPAYAGLFAHDPRFDEVWAIDVRKRGARLTNALAWIRRVRRGRYDLVVDLQRTDRSRLLLTLLLLTGGAPRYRLGNRGGFPYTHRPEVTEPRAHAFLLMRSVLHALGIPTPTTHPVLHASPQQEARLTALMQAEGLAPGRFALFLPGSQAAGWLKRWGAARYRALAQLVGEAGLAERVAVVGGPDEVEECAAICAELPVCVNLNGRLELLQIAPLARQAAFVVANDTGTAHIAAAADRPMLVLCGPTDPARVRPLGERVSALQALLPCRSCYAKDCRNARQHECMQRLTPELVLHELRALLGLAPAPVAGLICLSGLPA